MSLGLFYLDVALSAYHAGRIKSVLFAVFNIDGQGGGGGHRAAFLRVFVFCAFTSNRLVGDTHVELVDK